MGWRRCERERAKASFEGEKKRFHWIIIDGALSIEIWDGGSKSFDPENQSNFVVPLDVANTWGHVLIVWKLKLRFRRWEKRKMDIILLKNLIGIKQKATISSNQTNTNMSWAWIIN